MFGINHELMQILVCPESHEPLKPVAFEDIERINEAIRQRALRNISGETVSEEIEGALVREDGERIYPVRDGIPVMLIEEGFEFPLTRME